MARQARSATEWDHGAEIELLLEVSRMLDSAMDLRDVLEPVLKRIAEKMGLMRGAIALVNVQSGAVEIEAAFGLSHSERQRGQYGLGEGVTGRVVESGKPIVVPSIGKDPRFLNRTGARKNLRQRDIAFICVPILIGQEPIGALSVDRPAEGARAPEADARLLSIVASMIAQATKLRQMMREQQRVLREENERLQSELRKRLRPSDIIGSSNEMQGVLEMIEQVSQSNATVLLRGESGTGKELVAHAIHANSLRSSKPYIKVNCAALPETIIESELFGHEKGAFTGAVSQRKGRFELASGGTIFLDEIGYVSLATQVRLLRVLQEREFERVGGVTTQKCDVRVIAATNRNLEELMAMGAFLQDLYYRLNVFPIHIPPLRDRRSDILMLADHFVEKYNRIHSKAIKRISTPAIDLMMSYHWPGNVRELENCIERAMLVSSEDVIYGHSLPPTLQSAESSGTTHAGALRETLDNIERDLLIDALKSTRGNSAKAARALGLTERVMGLRIAKHDINPKRFRSKQP